MCYQVRQLRGPSGEYGAHGVVDIEQDASRVYDFMRQVCGEPAQQQQHRSMPRNRLHLPPPWQCSCCCLEGCRRFAWPAKQQVS